MYNYINDSNIILVVKEILSCSCCWCRSWSKLRKKYIFNNKSRLMIFIYSIKLNIKYKMIIIPLLFEFIQC